MQTPTTYNYFALRSAPTFLAGSFVNDTEDRHTTDLQRTTSQIESISRLPRNQRCNPMVTCHPALLEHPHDIGEAQVTEPFWQQYPPWSHTVDQPNQFSSGYLHHRGIMDTQPVVIGFNTRNGHPVRNETRKPFVPGKGKGRFVPRPEGKVDVYVGDTFLKEVPLALLLRFSTAARNAFPNPKFHIRAANRIEEAERNIAGIQAQDSGTTNTTSLEVSAPQSQEAVENLGKKTLNVYLHTLYIQPPREAFNFAFDWMFVCHNLTKGKRPDNKTSNYPEIPTYGFPEPDNVALSMLVDLYAAALCLGLRPPPHQLRQDIYARLRTSPPMLRDVIHIHETLPITDWVFEHMIKSFIANRKKSKGAYTKDEREAIEMYFHLEDDDLYYRFEKILVWWGTPYAEKLRIKQEKRSLQVGRDQVQSHSNAENKPSKAPTGDVAVQGSSQNAANEDKVTGQEAGPSNSNVHGRRRDRRKKGSNKQINSQTQG